MKDIKTLMLKTKLQDKEKDTYVRIVGSQYKKTPILFLHGGPGSTHNSFEVLDDFSDYDSRPIIMYDQYGCGLTSLGLENDSSLYNKETWVDELIQVREQLKLDKVHIMGHSWGGMLAIIYLCDYNPKGVLSLTLSSTLASASLWDKETHRLLKYLNSEDQAAIKEAERTNDYSSKDFEKANINYMKMFVRNLDEMKEVPECLTREKKTSPSYVTAWGPSEFKPLGNLKDYEYLDKLKNIKSKVMILSGSDDESTPIQNKAMYDWMTCDKEWHIIYNARHSTYIEQKEVYEEYLKNFIDKYDN